MILTCPSCGTQYVVKDGAIPPGGRQVRCAACKHSWHQDNEDSVEPETQPIDEAPAGEAAAVPEREDESITEATLIEPRTGPEAEERAYEEAEVEGGSEGYASGGSSDADFEKAELPASDAPEDWHEPPQAEAQDDEFTPFPPADEVEPRRRNPVIAIAAVILVVIVLAAAFWFLAPPEFKARLGLAGVSASPLALVTTHMDRRPLESGQELLTVTGRVINPTGREQAVPPLRAQLKTRAGKVVYSWTIPPPMPSLASGASASFNSAELVSPGGDELTITLAAGAG